MIEKNLRPVNVFKYDPALAVNMVLLYDAHFRTMDSCMISSICSSEEGFSTMESYRFNTYTFQDHGQLQYLQGSLTEKLGFQRGNNYTSLHQYKMENLFFLNM